MIYLLSYYLPLPTTCNATSTIYYYQVILPTSGSVTATNDHLVLPSKTDHYLNAAYYFPLELLDYSCC